jgi:hypothetical protein
MMIAIFLFLFSTTISTTSELSFVSYGFSSPASAVIRPVPTRNEYLRQTIWTRSWTDSM